MHAIRRTITRLRRVRAKPGHGKRKGLACFLIGVGILILISLFVTKLTPIVSEMAVATAKNVITRAINNTVAEHLEDGEMDYNKLVTVEKDTAGTVTALVINMSSVNALKAEITYGIISNLAEEDTADIGVPIGNLIGGNLFSGRGPEIPIRIVSVSSISTDFANRFSAAGINQTRHQIVVQVTVTASLLIPGRTEETTVSTEVAVAETIIVGDVPDSYTYFEGDDKWDESLEQFDILH